MSVFLAAQFPLETLDTPGVFTNLIDVFDEGLRRSKGGPFLGHRPLLSKKPPTWANYHVWQSWPEVDARRRAVGSALHKLFQSKELGGGPLDTVGIWSKNCPSTFYAMLPLYSCCILTMTRRWEQTGC